MAFTNFTQFIYIFLVLFCVVNALKEPTESAQNNIIQSSNYYVGNYYSGIDTSLNGLAFEKELTELISTGVNVLSYSEVWSAFSKTDTIWDSCPGTIHDLFSSKCWAYSTNQCGNYQKEGDCYNREHTWAKSWWGGSESSPAFTDLHHVFPTDGYDNAMRSNYPMGNINANSQTYVTSNGCMLGKCNAGEFGSAITCWEMADDVKGDVARAYFYMSTRYLDLFTCCSEPGVTNAHINSWMESFLRSWHEEDPVSNEERDRNEIIYLYYQNNRNPFVDHPEWVDKIYDF